MKNLKTGDVVSFQKTSYAPLSNQIVDLEGLEGTVVKHDLGDDTIAIEMSEYFEYLDEWENIIYFSEQLQNIDSLDHLVVVGNSAPK